MLKNIIIRYELHSKYATFTDFDEMQVFFQKNQTYFQKKHITCVFEKLTISVAS